MSERHREASLLTKLRSRLTYANVVSTLCLFILLGGSAVAAVSLKRNSVKGKHIAPNAVTSPKVRDGSLLTRDFAPGTLLRGELGATGAEGPRGLQGAPGSDAEFNGAAAGGDLTGTYPNPEIGALPAARALFGSFAYNGTSCVSGVGNETERAICYPNEEYDTDAMHPQFSGELETTKLIAPRDGVYAVTAGMIWTSGSVVGTRQLSIKRNDGAYVAAEQFPAGPAGNGTIHNVHGTIRLGAGSYVQAFAWQNSGGALDIYGPQDGRSFFEMHWIGPF